MVWGFFRAGPVRPSAKTRFCAKSTFARRVADVLVYRKNHPEPVFLPPGFSVVASRRISGRGPHSGSGALWSNLGLSARSLPQRPFVAGGLRELRTLRPGQVSPQRLFTESLAVSETLGYRHASGRGCPLLRWGTQGQIPGTALHLLPFGPPCRGWPSSRTACPAVRTSGRGAVSSGKPFSASPGTYCPAGRRPRSLPAKGTLTRLFLEGTQAAFGRASPRGAYWLSARRPRACRLKTKALVHRTLTAENLRFSSLRASMGLSAKGKVYQRFRSVAPFASLTCAAAS